MNLSDRESLADLLRRHESAVVLLIAFLAFTVRLAAAYLLRGLEDAPGSEFGADGIEFHTLAVSLLNGEGYALHPGQPTSFRAPAFSFALALIYWLGGVKFSLAYVFFSLLGAVTCVLAYVLAKYMLPIGWAVLVGLFTALYVPHIYFATLFASENLMAPLLTGGLCLLIPGICRSRSNLVWLAGLVFGLATLTRPYIVLALPLLMGIIVWSRSANRSRGVMLATIFALCWTGLLLPWTIRNYSVFGQPVLVATNGGSTFYGSNNDLVLNDPDQQGAWVSTKLLPGREWIESEPNEAKRAQRAWDLGAEWVARNASALPRLALYKFLRLWLPDVYSENRNYALLQAVAYTPFLMLFGVGAVGFLLSGQRLSPAWWAINAVILATVAAALVFWGSTRFRDVNAPLLMMYAALGAQTVFGRSRIMKHFLERLYAPDPAT